VRSELDAKDGGEATMIIKAKPAAKQARALRRRAPRKPFPVWPVLVGLLLFAVVIGGILLVSRDDGNPGKAASGGAVTLQGVASFDPQGDGEEHTERVGDATDGNAATYWTTERYNSFSKPGVGLVLDAGAARELSQIAVTTDTPGFTAEIRAGDSPEGPFDTVVGSSRTVNDSTTWDLEGAKSRYYVVWITQLDRVAHINEAEAN
jgi:putative peptidoglycan lipid II flippase